MLYTFDLSLSFSPPFSVLDILTSVIRLILFQSLPSWDVSMRSHNRKAYNCLNHKKRNCLVGHTKPVINMAPLIPCHSFLVLGKHNRTSPFFGCIAGDRNVDDSGDIDTDASAI